MNALCIYGQMRTFDTCIPTILNYINYDKNNFDVFLFIDKNDINGFNEHNLTILKNLLGENKIKILKYTDDMSKDEIKIETELSEKYKIISKNIKEYLKIKNLQTNDFVSKLYYRRHLLLGIVKEYSITNNVHYDSCVLTRFDICINDCAQNAFDINLDEINKTNNLFVKFDLFFHGRLDNLIKIFYFAFNYFAIYDTILQKNEQYLKNILNMLHNKNLGGDELYKIYCDWLCMPELNFHVYLIIQNTKFNQLFNQSTDLCFIKR